METRYSVLMSIYKKEKPEYFVQSLESMVNQTLMPDEIVIVKDGELTKKDIIDSLKNLNDLQTLSRIEKIKMGLKEFTENSLKYGSEKHLTTLEDATKALRSHFLHSGS